MPGMATITAADWLRAWETCATRAPHARAIELLGVASAASRDSLARMPLGRRDALLLELRARLFGAELACTATCPACAGRLEFEIPQASVEARSHDASAAGAIDTELAFASGDWSIRYRLPHSLDLLRASHCTDVASARASLLHACVLDATLRG